MVEQDFPARIARFLAELSPGFEISNVEAELVDPNEFDDDPGGLNQALRVVVSVKVPAARADRPLPLVDLFKIRKIGALEAEFGVPIFVQCEVLGPQPPRFMIGRAD